MQLNEMYGRHTAIVTGAVALGLLLHQLWRWKFSFRPLIGMMMVAVHPVWFLGVGSGDCGLALRERSDQVLWVMGALVAYHLSVVWKEERRTARAG